MDKNSLKECLLAKFRFWVLTTKLRDEISQEKILFNFRTSTLSIFDISNIINMSLIWKHTKCGYDICSEAQLEWSILVAEYYFSLKESGAFSEICQENIQMIEQQIYDAFSMSLEKYKFCSSLWPKRYKRKTNKTLIKLLEEHEENLRDSKLTQSLKNYEYF